MSPSEPTKPLVRLARSVDGSRWVVFIDTDEDTGHVTVRMNDEVVFSGDPETFDVGVVTTHALAELDPDPRKWPAAEQTQAIIRATRGGT